MENRSVEFLLKYRYLFSILSLFIILVLGFGSHKLTFDSDYKSFFDKDDPQLIAFDNLQSEYTKSESLVFLIKPEQGDIFTPQYLELIKNITQELWAAPFSVRVDSLSNFQYSWAENDNLIVEELVRDDLTLDSDTIQRIRDIALHEKELVDRIISANGQTTMINVSMDLPEIDSQSPKKQQLVQKQAREASFAEITDYGNQIKNKIQQQYPELEVHMIGVPVLNYSFNLAAAKDSETLIPLMYGIILIALAIFFRSVASVFACMIIIVFSTLGGIGMAGWMGYSLNSITVISPIIILTIAVCDSVHLIVMYQRHLAMGESPLDSIRESLAANFQPIVLTSITTTVGFLTLNFSGSPTFRAFGNISAFGVMVAMLISLTLMPTLITLIIRRGRKAASSDNNTITAIANFVINHKTKVFWYSLTTALFLVALVPLNHTNNDPINYLKEGVPYRDAATFARKNMPGIKELHFSVNCGASACINEPDFLVKLESFTDWLSMQPEVEYVGTYTNVIKRLNRNMHDDELSWYQLPKTRELAAQYQLLYELSLPYGLDMNHLINFDKNASRVSVWVKKIRTPELILLEQRAQAWFDQHAPELKTPGSSVDMMFAVQNMEGIYSMSWGAIFALIGVTLTILIATRSLRHGLLSVIPNAFPAAMALGIWGVIIGEVNSAVTIVFSITLGLVVDNTVHFISKYRRGLSKGKSVEDAIRYAFSTVGSALTITAVVLTIGFSLLTLSDFNLNAYMGGLTAITIIIALIFDFLMLPALLLLVDKRAETLSNKSI